MSDQTKALNFSTVLAKKERKVWVGSTPYPGGGLPRVAVACYDVSGGDSGSQATHGLGVWIPKGSHVFQAWYEVVTTFTDGSTDAATIALQVEAANDIKTATSIATGTTWDDAVPVACNPTNPILTTDHREISAKVATANVTAGKLYVYVVYCKAGA